MRTNTVKNIFFLFRIVLTQVLKEVTLKPKQELIVEKSQQYAKNVRTLSQLYHIHMQSHKGIQPFSCKECNKSFSQNQHLKAHFLIYCELKPIKCEHCRKSFRRYHHFKSHLNYSYSQEKQFKCDVCNKAFKTMEQVKIHSKIHSAKNKYKCLLCTKAYPFQNSLKVYMTSHSRL